MEKERKLQTAKRFRGKTRAEILAEKQLEMERYADITKFLKDK